MERSDPLERLRAANPVPGRTALPPPDRILFHQIVSGRSAARPPRHRQVRRLAPVVLLVASILGGTVAYAVYRAGVTRPETVACYERADLEARAEVVSVGNEGPVSACAELWRRGVLGTGGAVPTLEECVLLSGVAGVFPVTGSDVCSALTVAPVPGSGPQPSVQVPPPVQAPPAPDDVNARVLALRDALVPQFLDAGCLAPPAAAGIVRTELDRVGLGDWTIRAGEGAAGDGFSADRPCATLSFRPDTREVVLVPSAPRR